MDIQVLFFYLPSTIFTILAFAFLLLWRSGLSSSWQWAAGFAQTASGFGLSSFPIEPSFDQFVSGLLFISAAYCYGSAILIHFGVDPAQRIRRGIAVGFFVPHAYLVNINPSLRLDLFLIEMVFALLIGLVVWQVTCRAKTAADRSLVVATTLVMLDCLVRGIVFTFVYPTSDNMGDFLQSAYNISVHVTTITLCLIFPFAAIAAMASVALDQHKQEAARDPLTGLLNRRGFRSSVASISVRAVPSGVIVMMDIDHFKTINDRFGHAVGDRVIIEVANRLESLADKRVTVGRFGGEEFVAFIHHAREDEALHWADVVRKRIKQGWQDAGFDLVVTASFGVSEVGRGGRAWDTALSEADEALYRAKLGGRDRVAGSHKFPLEESETGAKEHLIRGAVHE